MGNPNARSKKDEARKFSVGSGSTGSPMAGKVQKSLGSGSTMLLGQDSPTKGNFPDKAASVISDASPTQLRFKSYKTGTLNTNNGVPTHLLLAPLPPPAQLPTPQSSPERSRKPSSSSLNMKLDANVAAFVPQTPQQLHNGHNNSAQPSSNTPTPALQQVQNLLQELRFPPKGHAAQRRQHNGNGGLVDRGHGGMGTSSVAQPPRQNGSGYIQQLENGGFHNHGHHGFDTSSFDQPHRQIGTGGSINPGPHDGGGTTSSVQQHHYQHGNGGVVSPGFHHRGGSLTFGQPYRQIGNGSFAKPGDHYHGSAPAQRGMAVHHNPAGANHHLGSSGQASPFGYASPTHSVMGRSHSHGGTMAPFHPAPGPSHSRGGPGAMNHTPAKSPQPPIRSSNVYYERIDKSQKDIIISADGVWRNAVKVTESCPTSNTPSRSYNKVFEGKYDFVSDFHNMTAKEKADLLLVKQVEIVVDIKSHDEPEEPKEGKKKNKRGGKGRKRQTSDAVGNVSQENGMNGTNGEASNALVANDKGKGKETAEPTVIDTLNALGSVFAGNVKNLMVTLDFQSIAVPLAIENGQEPIPSGPRGTVTSHAVGPDPLVIGPNFAFMTELVETLQSFTGLNAMTINLRVRSSHATKPVTIQQLALVLPFYDLGFQNWSVGYQMEFLTTVVPISEREYPIKWLDRERTKVLYQREKKIEDARFVRPSLVGGQVADWRKM